MRSRREERELETERKLWQPVVDWLLHWVAWAQGRPALAAHRMAAELTPEQRCEAWLEAQSMRDRALADRCMAVLARTEA